LISSLNTIRYKSIELRTARKHIMIRDLVNSQLETIYFTRADVREDNLLYIAEITGALLGKIRYVILVVPLQLDPKVEKARAKNLPWVNVQTRTIPRMFLHVRLSPQSLHIPRDVEDIRLPVLNRNVERTLYYCEDGSHVNMLHDPKKKSAWQYPEHMFLSASLQSFNSSITCPLPQSERPIIYD
jgi:hypothetical protein